MSFPMYASSVFGEIISRNGVKPYPQKLKAMMEMPPPKQKKTKTKKKNFKHSLE